MSRTPVLRRLPSLEQLARELARNSRERRVLRAIQAALLKKQKSETAGRVLARREVQRGK